MTLPASPMRDALAACASPLEAPDTPKGAPREQAAGPWQRTYCFPATALVFAGHFPGQPVLPAVVQTLMAQMTVEAAVAAVGTQAAINTLPRLLAVTHAKFTAMLGPDMPITVQVRPAAKADHWDCVLYARTAPHEDGTLAARIQLHMEHFSVPREVHA